MTPAGTLVYKCRPSWLDAGRWWVVVDCPYAGYTTGWALSVGDR